MFSMEQWLQATDNICYQTYVPFLKDQYLINDLDFLESWIQFFLFIYLNKTHFFFHTTLIYQGSKSDTEGNL